MRHKNLLSRTVDAPRGEEHEAQDIKYLCMKQDSGLDCLICGLDCLNLESTVLHVPYSFPSTYECVDFGEQSLRHKNLLSRGGRNMRHRTEKIWTGRIMPRGVRSRTAGTTHRPPSTVNRDPSQTS